VPQPERSPPNSLIASIPATILLAFSPVTVTSTTANGAPVYRLTWKSAFAS
jgi:hypothetical protein